MAKRTHPGDWRAEGITLEPAALRVTKGSQNTIVIAGPGAGKTELLAQRASFLLETETCPFPFRILAISFKRESAENLRKRVLLRCGEEFTRRFDSMTYDAFAKDLVDRFLLALPAEYRPTANYGILTGREAGEESFRQALLSLSTKDCPLSPSVRQSITAEEVVRI